MLPTPETFNLSLAIDMVFLVVVIEGIINQSSKLYFMRGICSLGASTNLAPPTTFEVGKFGLALLRWGEIMPDLKLFRPIKLSGRALYDDGQTINSNVISHVTKERLV